MFWFQKPKPKFRVGALVRRTNTDDVKLKYVLITSRRWVRPIGHTKKLWVYDGPVLCTKGASIVRSTFISCILENHLEYVGGLRTK